jgi:hypothetical protein
MVVHERRCLGDTLRHPHDRSVGFQGIANLVDTALGRGIES